MPHAAAKHDQIDTGLVCTVILAGVHGIPADPRQLQHEFAAAGEPFESREILRLAKLLNLKARVVTSRWDRLSKLTLPAIARHKDGHYFVLGKVGDDHVLIQAPLEKRPLSLPRELFEQAWSGELILFTRRAGVLDELRKFDFSWFIPEILKHKKLIGEVTLGALPFYVLLSVVVTPAQTLMVIVPKESTLEVEAFPCTKYGVIDAEPTDISPNAISDEKLGLVYRAQVLLKASKILVKDKWVNLSPGMAVTVEVKTGKRRLIEYFLSPLLKYTDESIRER